MVNLFDLFSTVILILLTMFFGVLIVLFIVKAYVKLFIKNKLISFLKDDNISATLVLISIIISSLFLCSATVTILQQNIHLAGQINIHERLGYILRISILGIIQIILSVLTTLFISFISVKLYDFITKDIKEFTEILESKNISVGLLLAGIILGEVILLKHPISILISMLIPLPKYDISF